LGELNIRNIFILLFFTLFSFGSSKRFPDIDEDDILPGPGKYNAPSFTCTAPAYLFKKPMEDDDIIYDL
jgi:hypothetical protein